MTRLPEPTPARTEAERLFSLLILAAVNDATSRDDPLHKDDVGNGTRAFWQACHNALPNFPPDEQATMRPMVEKMLNEAVLRDVSDAWDKAVRPQQDQPRRQKTRE